MDDTDPTSIIQMINDLKSSSCGYRRSSGVSLRLSGTGVPMALLEESGDCETPPKRKRLDDSTSASKAAADASIGSASTTPASPWEWRRLKGELVSLRTRLSHQDANVQQLHKIRRQMEEVFDKEKTVMENQAELDRQTIKQLEARLAASRRTCQEARDSQAKAEKDLSQVRAKLEAKVTALMNENARLIQDARSPRLGADSRENGAESARVAEDNELRDRLTRADERIAELEEKLRRSRESQRDAELRAVEFQNIRLKLEALEAERAIWEEGKHLSARAARASELERELAATRETLRAMRESVRGKLLLEEEMRNVRQRLEHVERLEEQVAKLESERAELSRKLERYASIGFDGDPCALRREMNRLQQSEAVLTAEEGQLRSRIESSLRENNNLTRQLEEAKKMASEMILTNERLNKLVGRLQKKMILVTRERDSYRQQLDLYEKEMTTLVDNNGTAHIERVAHLERALEGYRDLVAKLESDLEGAGSLADKEECNKLRAEIDRMKGELEHRALKGDFNCNARIMHFTMNPAAIASKQAEEKQLALLREVEELRARVQAGAGASAVGVSSLQAQEIAELKQTHEIKIARLKEAFKLSSQEYRQACYQLFGWRVDRTKEGEYKLFSQYAESPDDFLFFHVGDEGVDLLETNFSAGLGTLIERHLQLQHSVPMFINAVQCELFAQQTVANVV